MTAWTHHDPAVRRLIREAQAVAWDEGHDECCASYVRHCATAANPYREETQ